MRRERDPAVPLTGQGLQPDSEIGGEHVPEMSRLTALGLLERLSEELPRLVLVFQIRLLLVRALQRRLEVTELLVSGGTAARVKGALRLAELAEKRFVTALQC